VDTITVLFQYEIFPGLSISSFGTNP
ncbi:uncharacterized protein METZ01_LOCUS87763, partial [marine metagenome]